MLDLILDGAAVIVLVVLVMLALDVAYWIWRGVSVIFWAALGAYLDHQDRRAGR